MTRHSSQAASVNVEHWNIDAFSARLKEAMRDKTAYSLEKETGIAQSLIRKYLSAKSAPGADKLVVLSRALGVSASWLLIGEAGGDEAPARPVPATAPAMDLDALEDVITKVRTMVRNKRPDLSPRAEARIIRLVYEFLVKQGETMDEAALDNVIELAAFR